MGYESSVGAARRLVFESCLILIFVLLSYAIFPLVLVAILIPMYAFRFLIAKLGPLFRPELGKMLTTLSSSFVVDIRSVYKEPKNVILIYAELEGTLDIRKLQESWSSVLELADPKGALLYPELKQRIVSWLGFFFWENASNFKIENHVRLLESYQDSAIVHPSVHEVSVTEWSHRILTRPFMAGQSPWEFLVLPLVSPSSGAKTLVFLRSHHALADGYSLFQLVLRQSKVKQVNQVKPEIKTVGEPKRTVVVTVGNIFKAISFPFRIPYDVISQLVRARDKNEWHVSEKQMARTSSGIISASFPVRVVKEVKRSQGVPFAAVLLSGFAGAVRNTMIKQGVQKIPRSVHCLTPMPLPGHSEKLRNYMTGCLVELPLDITDPLERLRAIEADLQRIRKSTVLHSNFLLHRMVGGMFIFLMRILWRPVLSTTAMSSFPGFDKETEFVGRRILRTGFVGHVGTGNLGVLLTAFSYNGDLELCLSADKSIITSASGLKKLMDSMRRELETLCGGHIV